MGVIYQGIHLPGSVCGVRFFMALGWEQAAKTICPSHLESSTECELRCFDGRDNRLVILADGIVLEPLERLVTEPNRPCPGFNMMQH